MINVIIENTGTTLQVPGATPLAQIAAQTPGFSPTLPPLCALVNNKVEGLDFEIYNPKTVRFLTMTSPSGHRTYVRSLCMMLYVAVRSLFPGAGLRLEHSVAGGYYCRFTGMEPSAANIARVLEKMRALHAARLRFVRHEEPTDKVIALFRNQGLDSKVALLETSPQPYTVYHTLEGVADCYYGCLAPHTGCIALFDLTPYHQGALLRAPLPQAPEALPPVLNQEKMFDAFTNYLEFNKIIGVSNVGELNRVDLRGQTSQLINVAEAMHEKYIAAISQTIAARYARGGARLVLIAGPSSSGKTTFTKRLAVQLRTCLLSPIQISLDDYFVNRADTPRDHTGDYDYESLYALDINQFNTDLANILQGRQVELPTYNFELGQRQYRGNRVRLDANTIILIEGIHGLNPELTAHIPRNNKFLIYVSALTTLSIDAHNWISTTDNRLLRRIIRDAKYRGTDATETIRRWPSVRRGEDKWIFPYQENADAMFNSSLIYELGVMRSYGLEVLAKVPPTVPEYAQAYRLRKFLGYFRPIPATMIPPTSLLREFLGGSSFHY